MSIRHTLTVSAVVACLVAGAVALPAQAFSDRKFLHPSVCVPYGPDTTLAELQYSATGIYNPGTQIEQVLCPLPRDQEGAYTTGQLLVGVYYRGFSPGDSRLTCTLYIGSASMQTGAVFSHTVSGPNVKNGARADLDLKGGTQVEFATVPTSVVCAMWPKTSLAGMFHLETGITQTP